MDFQPSLFSSKATAGRRTFFFDVKNTKDSKPYLKITQSEKNGEEKKRVNVNVFDSEVPEFMSALNEAVEFINQKAI